jgi:hypothetical protein
LFDRVADLEDAVPFERASVERITGSSLVQTEHSTDYFTVYRGPSPLFELVELREPTSRGRGGIVRLTLDKPVARAKARGRFGEVVDVAMPGPMEPPGSATHYIYRRPWGEVRLGCRGDDLVTIVLDATSG